MIASRPRRTWALAVAGGAAALACSCCLLPLALFFAGFSGAWMAHLRIMEPYSPWLVALSALALGISWKPIFRPAGICPAASGALTARTCAARPYKVFFWILALLIVALLLTPLIAPLFY